MEIKLTLNGERIVQDIEPDLLLIDFVRKNGCILLQNRTG